MELGIGKRIKKRRTDLGLTQEDLARRMGYKSKAAICKVENGEDNITTDRISKFAEALETTPSYLMGWDENPPNSDDVLLHVLHTEKDYEFIELYKKASPEIQEAVYLLLKSAKHDP